MIENARQFQVTLQQVRKFAAAIKVHDETVPSSDIAPSLWKVEREAMAGTMAELIAELDAFIEANPFHDDDMAADYLYARGWRDRRVWTMPTPDHAPTETEAAALEFVNSVDDLDQYDTGES